MYPIKNLSVGGKNIYGPIDLQEILEKLLTKFSTKFISNSKRFHPTK